MHPQSFPYDIHIQITPQYHPEHSNPTSRYWFFSYRIRITNESVEAVQLLARHWVITDANGHIEHVQGPGVVGEQPILASGESFEYTSYCPLSTPMGFMEGSYQMVTQHGDFFSTNIPAFTLVDPNTLN